MTRACAICGATGAHFGLRLPGPRSGSLAARRGYLWHCAAPACAEAALARRARVIGGPAPRRDPLPEKPPEAEAPRQSSLFGD